MGKSLLILASAPPNRLESGNNMTHDRARAMPNKQVHMLH